MEDFDIQISMNGVENELNANLVGNSKKEMFSRFEGDSTDVVPEEQKKSFADTLNSLTQTFKEVTGFKTNEQIKAQQEKELAEKGTKYKVLGMNPFVAIGVSLLVIIGGSYAITKIKAS
jgi:phenylalanyl-tRNA synthetase alpha subunit